MASVIAQPCEGVCDTACVQVCPCDCIHGPVSEKEMAAIPRSDRSKRLAGIQLYIDPQECIDCALCVDVCPVGAIFPGDELPAEWQHYIRKNADFFLMATPQN